MRAYADLLSGLILCANLTRVWQPRVLFYRQGIEICANENSWAGPVFHDCDHAVAGPLRILVLTYALGDGKSERPQLAGKKRRRLLFIMRKLRRRMIVLSIHERWQYCRSRFDTRDWAL